MIRSGMRVMTRSDTRSNRPAIEIADILRRHGDAYRRVHAGHLGRVERRVMSAIVACRTEALGGHMEACDDCGTTRVAYNSCRNRHCPKCQGRARAAWLAARQADLLPVPYFHVVFTLPAPIAAIAFQNKAVVYAILFKAAAEAMTTLAANPRRLGGAIGGVAALPPWGRRLFIIPTSIASFRVAASRPMARAGSLADRTSSWPSNRCPDYFAHFFSNVCRQPSTPVPCVSSAISELWPSRLPSRPTSTPCDASTGLFTPSGPSAGPHRCWPISAATPIASPSPTAGS